MKCPNCNYEGEFVDDFKPGPESKRGYNNALQKPRAKDLIYCPCCFWHIRRDGENHIRGRQTNVRKSNKVYKFNQDSFEKMIKEIYADIPRNPNHNRPVW